MNNAVAVYNGSEEMSESITNLLERTVMKTEEDKGVGVENWRK
jgi:hypothetical protein